MLAINGELDLQVLPDQNLPVIEAALKKGGNKDYTITRMPGLNHLLQTAKTGLPGEYRQIETTIAPAALDLQSPPGSERGPDWRSDPAPRASRGRAG